MTGSYQPNTTLVLETGRRMGTKPGVLSKQLRGGPEHRLCQSSLQHMSCDVPSGYGGFSCSSDSLASGETSCHWKGVHSDVAPFQHGPLFLPDLLWHRKGKPGSANMSIV